MDIGDLSTDSGRTCRDYQAMYEFCKVTTQQTALYGLKAAVPMAGLS